MTTIKNLEQYFKDMRFSETNHLGMGDIRLTIANQEEIIELVKVIINEAQIYIGQSITNLIFDEIENLQEKILILISKEKYDPRKP